MPPEARRQFLLLFDLSFTGVSGLMRSRRAAHDFIRTGLGPTDLASVATFSATHGLTLLTAFTSDRVQLQRAVNTLGVLQRDRAADPLGLAYDLTDVGAAFTDALPEEGAVPDAIRSIQLRYQRSQEIGYRQRILALLDGMASLAKALDSVQGRKQVIFLSNGFDDTALVGEQGRQAQLDAEAVSRGRVWEVPTESRFGDSQVREVMTEMLRSFSSADAVVHSVDLSGLAARGDARSQQGEATFRSGRESLAEMANLSGGRLFKDVNDVGVVFRELSEMSRRYYLLAFEPEERAQTGPVPQAEGEGADEGHGRVPPQRLLRAGRVRGAVAPGQALRGRGDDREGRSGRGHPALGAGPAVRARRRPRRGAGRAGGGRARAPEGQRVGPAEPRALRLRHRRGR